MRYELEKPKCAKCGVEMWLARIAPDAPGHDKRTFECPACDSAITKVVRYQENE